MYNFVKSTFAVIGVATVALVVVGKYFSTEEADVEETEADTAETEPATE